MKPIRRTQKTAFLLLFCILFALFPAFSPAISAKETVKLTVSEKEAERGGEVTLDIVMDAGENPVTAWQFCLEYDEEVLHFQKVEHCPENRGVSLFPVSAQDDWERYGHPLMLAATLQPPDSFTGKIVIARVTFSVDADAVPGVYPVTIEQCKNGGNTLFWKNGKESVYYTQEYEAGEVHVRGDLALRAETSAGSPVKVGDSFTVRYVLENPKALPVESYAIHIQYDDDRFVLRELSIPEEIGGKNTSGSVSLSGSSADGRIGDGGCAETEMLILTAVFTVREDAFAGNSRIGALLTAQDGIRAPAREGQEGEKYAVEFAPCTVEVQSARRLPGDVDGDGSVTVRDVTLLLGVLAEKADLPEKSVGDLNGDGRITAKDVSRLLRLLGEA